VISDRTAFAYVLDVFVDEGFRMQGIGLAMVKHILACQDLKSVRRWLLFTQDAHEVYKKVGFQATLRANGLMEIIKQRNDLK
jgi:GNAT superfamily N-acetyltransferase